MREQRKQLIGVVTSDKMDKTVVVAVATTKRHPKYGTSAVRLFPFWNGLNNGGKR